MRWTSAFALPLLFVVAACGDKAGSETDTPDDGAADSAGIEDTGPSAGDSDATDTAGEEVADVADATDSADAPGPVLCACDLTPACEEGCACDIACGAEVGPSPLGAESIGLERNEIAVFDATDADAPRSRVSLYDDGAAGAHRSMYTASETVDGDSATVSLSADVDGDGRDEAVVVTSTGVQVHDWDGTTLAARTVYTYDAADRYDAAEGDLEHDGGHLLVVTRQVGDTVTVEVLDIGLAGQATVRASVSVPSVTRHAVAVAPPAAGESPLVYLLVARAPANFAEPLELYSFGLDGATLAERGRVDLATVCTVGFGSLPNDDGLALAVGDLDNVVGSEIAIAAYCPTTDERSPSLSVSLQTLKGVGLGYATPFGLSESDAYSRSGPVRPLLALGRFDTPTGDPGASRAMQVVVGLTLRGEDAYVVTYDLAHSHTISLTGAERSVRPQSVLTGLAVRDLNGDGVDEIVAVTTDVSTDLGGTHFGGSVVSAGYTNWRVIHDGSGWSYYSEALQRPLVAVGDFDQDSMRVRATGVVYRHISEPRINNVVAAPPTWQRDGVKYGGGSETTFGVASSNGTSNGGVATWGLSVSAGAGISIYKLVELYGYATFSAGITHSWTWSSTMTVTRAITANEAADLVSYSQVIYASHEYEVVSHPDPEMIGKKIRVDVPGRTIELTTSVPQFRATIPNADLMLPPTLLAHTVGRPDTYDHGGACTNEALQARIGTGVVKNAYESTELTDVGNAPSGSRTVGVDFDTQYEVGLDAVFEVGGVVGGALIVGGSVTAYVGGGYSYRRTVGHTGSYSGTVGVISEGYGPDTRYEWGLCVFNWSDAASAEHASYPVTTYVVTPY